MVDWTDEAKHAVSRAPRNLPLLNTLGMTRFCFIRNRFSPPV
jgi:hypothetical protein